MPSIIFNYFSRLIVDSYNGFIYGGEGLDVRDTRDPQKIGQFIINRPKNMTANERADNLNAHKPEDFKYEPTKPDYLRNGK